MCMDLLTADGKYLSPNSQQPTKADICPRTGWLPSYRYVCGQHSPTSLPDSCMYPSISAILLQIKLAISNLDPKPARLSPNWDS